MLEIIFNGISLLGVLTLLVWLYYQIMEYKKEQRQRYFDDLRDSIEDAICYCMERYDLNKRRFEEEGR